MTARKAMKWLVTAVLLCWIAFRLDPGDAVAALRKVRPALLLLCLGAAALQIPLMTLRWRILLRDEGTEIGFREALKGIWIWLAAGSFVSGGLLAEAARYRFAKIRGSGTGVLRSIVRDRMLGLAAAGLAAVPGLIWLGDAFAVSVPEGAMPEGAAVIFLIGAGAALLFKAYPGAMSWVKGVFSLKEIRRLLVISFLLVCALALQFWLCLISTGAEFDGLAFLALYPWVLLATAVPVTPTSWGLREFSAMVMLAPLGLPAGTVVTASVLFGLMNLAVSAPGWLMVRGLSGAPFPEGAGLRA